MKVLVGKASDSTKPNTEEAPVAQASESLAKEDSKCQAFA